MAAMFPYPVAEWDPWYTPQEQAWFKTEEGNFLPNGWWKFADGCIAIHLSSSSMKELLQVEQTLNFYVPMLSSISKAVCERCVLCAPKQPQTRSKRTSACTTHWWNSS
jgi:hypothetical protein